MSQASDLLALYLDAEAKILKGQAVSMSGRSLTMADLTAVQTERKALEARVARESNSRGGFKAASFN
jgi:hypothetical protein